MEFGIQGFGVWDLTFRGRDLGFGSQGLGFADGFSARIDSTTPIA